ncbi:hypothetical protein RirG_143670 [Rhizophagus irregularis DAOM 197198w]|uniref:F-box domain-containing protein n=1 Tax=Rhizophagus irregularis (strain DAOM 197198w) TaxID=1432141 RepID=A0A015J4A7_RHIIW|nr:hypothetical protein RirG_143670 [Rhizophagus irregularis DAOM 197198w]
MACSKIFSGDLPELSYEIIQYFRKDISTLYSCILVNRLWCRLAIPLIWEDPFSLLTQNSRYINTYLCFLNEDGKARFNEYGINDNLLLLNTSFNYPRFIKYLDTFKISNSVEDWVITLKYKYNHMLGKLVYRSLIEVLLIENEVNSHSFEVVLDMNFTYTSYFDDTVDSILQNPNLTYNIRGLTLKVFDQLNVLESIHIIYCDSLDSDFVQQIFKVIKPFKLRSLFMKETIPNDHIESLLLLLQKFSDCLENFGFESGEIGQVFYRIQKQQLFEFIMKYCKKIRYFYSGIPYYGNNSIYLFIEKNQHNINYLTIEADITSYYDYGELSSTVLQNLGQVLPSRLEYLCLALSFITSDLEIFLNNSQNTFIKKLLISNKFQYTPLRKEDTEILFFIKKYIMKKERVKYLAIVESDSNASTEPVELFFLKNEVNEYKLNNIIVQKYNDLYIDAHSYINNHLQY